MEVSKKTNVVKFTGDVMTGSLTTPRLIITEDAVIDGNLILNGKLITPNSLEKEYDNIIYLGPKDINGTWRFFACPDGSLSIEKLVDGEWEIKQILT